VKDLNVANLFFFLSGEHPDLPIAELKSILETEGYQYRIVEKLDQIARIETDPRCTETLKSRAALTRLAALELFDSEAERNAIIKEVQIAKLERVLKENESFVVRIKHVGIHSPEIDGMLLEQKLGELILQNIPNTKVKLRNPDKTFIGVLTCGRLVFGLKLADIPAAPFVQRRPRKKPFFHPSAMPAKLGRCMINLAKPKKGQLVFDPFSGTGGILIEAALIGCRIVGLDIQRRMIRGTTKNLAYFKINPEGIILADARKPPVAKIDCMVCDPPYGRSSTTMKSSTEEIVTQVLPAVCPLLRPHQRVCIATPKTLNIRKIAEQSGYRHVESHFVYIHRTLTREIAVFEKK
jgi:tRNA (guanine10-N2)-dimethyltransferase